MKKEINIILLITVALLVGTVKIKALDGEYQIGEVVKYSDVNYIVIKNSNDSDSTVTLLKATPLTRDEVNLYGGVGTANNHVNMHVTTDTSSASYQKASRITYPGDSSQGYGGMAYYSSETCGYNANGEYSTSGCKLDYASSDIKYVVDAWAEDNTDSKDLQADSTGYSVRLLTLDDLEVLGYTKKNSGTVFPPTGDNAPSFLSTSIYWTWTMNQYSDYSDSMWTIQYYGQLLDTKVTVSGPVVRPVVIVKKKASGILEKQEISANEIEDSIELEKLDDDYNADSIDSADEIDSVPDTLLREPFISTIVGGTLLIISIVVSLIIINNRMQKSKIEK